MFLLVGMVERRCGTGDLDALGGMARGWPALATVLLVAGMVALAVPGSVSSPGSSSMMAAVYDEGWGYAAIVALGIVLAAMYTLRLISAVLHVRPGAAVRDEALDLRPGDQRARPPPCRVPARALRFGLHSSASSFQGDRPAEVIAEGFRVIDTPSVDWFALTPTLALLAAGGVALMATVLLPAWMRRADRRGRLLAGFVVAAVSWPDTCSTRAPMPTPLL